MKKIICKISFLIFIFPVTIIAQSKTTKLIEGEEHAYMSPVWSPDGSKIAFTSSGYEGIWVMNIADNNITQVTSEKAAGYKMKWSDNSKLILTRVAKYDGYRRYNAVKIFNIETSESFAITDYRTMMPGLPHFAMSDEKIYMFGREKLEIFDSGIRVESFKKPDSTEKIVYLRNDKIAVENLSVGQVKIYEPVKGERVLNLQVSPDGSKAVFEIYGGDLYIMNINGTGLLNLGKGYRPRWSPDNQQIVYMITEDDGYIILSSDIYTIKIDGTGKKNLTNSEEKIEMNPDWSPDGKKIAYDVPDEGAIYVMEIH